MFTSFNPHFSQGFYCGVTEDHVYCVALPQTPRRTVKYASGFSVARLVSTVLCTASLRNPVRKAG
jgi:hypothetical protein